MRAIFIDPKEQIIQEIQYNGDYKEISKIIGCQYFTVACDLPNGDTIYVDDEGLFNSDNDFFNISHGFQPYAGKALIVHTDSDGNSRAAKSTIEDLKSDIIFIPRWYLELKAINR